MVVGGATGAGAASLASAAGAAVLRRRATARETGQRGEAMGARTRSMLERDVARAARVK